MINPKYFADMQAFPQQFQYDFAVSLPLHFPNQPRVIVCGMGGSALYVPLLQDLLAQHRIPIRLDVCSSYTLPVFDPINTVVICASHSGTTEEIRSCLDDALAKSVPTIVFASGGALLEHAQANDLPLYQIPVGLQPRLATGYFIDALLDVLEQLGFPVTAVQKSLYHALAHLPEMDTANAQAVAAQLLNHVPIIYTTDVLKSMALICKIKCNENSKVPAFAHYIPELNHNEMCGRTGKTMQPYFLIFTSRFTHPRNLRRIQVLRAVLTAEGYQVLLIDPVGDSLEAEALWIYQYMDYVTYYLAEAQGIDPEPVQMVETFKQALG